MKKGSEIHPYFGFRSPSFDLSSGLLYDRSCYALPILISSFPRKTCCRKSFLFNRFYPFFSLNLFLYGVLNPSAELFAPVNGRKTPLAHQIHMRISHVNLLISVD